MRGRLKTRSVKSVSGPRSETKASIEPSGENAGCMSPCLSLVRRVISSVSMSSMNRSEMPPDCPANTIEPPSGDQAGLEMAPMLALSTSMRCSTSELSTSTMTSWLSPSAIATKANSCPSGDQEPEESRKRSASMCASEAALDSLRMILPVRASAMNRSTEKRSRSEMKAT